MSLVEERAEGIHVIRSVATDGIRVDDREFGESFVLLPDRAEESNWPANADALATADLDRLLALQPELILLGTGQKQTFPRPELLAHVLMRGVGMEVMDNAAAARTFNLLAGEGRYVAALFLL